MPRLTRSLLLIAVAVSLSSLPASADWLILRGGKRIETKGPWMERANKTIVFTEVDGHHSSVLISLVDTEATRLANLQAAKKGGSKVAKNTAGEGKAAITDDNTKRVDDRKAAAIAHNKEQEERNRLAKKQSDEFWDNVFKDSKRWEACRQKYPGDAKAQRDCADH
ncbi:MAG TPA: hypothetical protein VGE98_00265 [Thermoanaerobaculia bacterium]